LQALEVAQRWQPDRKPANETARSVLRQVHGSSSEGVLTMASKDASQERRKAHVEPMKRLRCPQCRSTSLKTTSTPINTDQQLHRWHRCQRCRFAFLAIYD